MKRLNKNKVIPVLAGAFYMTMVNTNQIMAAADTSSVTKPLESLKVSVK